MFIAMNRFHVRVGHEADFEMRWKERETFLHEMPGFVHFRLLRCTQSKQTSRCTQSKQTSRCTQSKQTSPASGDVERTIDFISHTEWSDAAAFEGWLASDRAKKAHHSAKPLGEALLGPPEFQGFETVTETFPGHRSDHRSAAMDAVVEAAFAQESEVQKQIRARNRAADLAAINVGALEGRLLEILLRSVGARRGVEIGTLGGYSGTWIARALPADGQLITIERDAARAEQARANFTLAGLAERVEVRTGSARDVLRNLESVKDLDFVFIDADKQSYAEYVDWAVRHLRSGGILLADNAYLWGGMLNFGRAAPGASSPEFAGMSACWSKLREHPELHSIILPTGEGLGVAVKS